MRITIVLPKPVAKPTGGYLVQYEYANRLADRGHRVTILHPWAEYPFRDRRWLSYTRELVRHHGGHVPLVSWFEFNRHVKVRLVPFLHHRLMPPADATIFTAWQTVNDFVGPVPQNSVHVVYDYEFWRTRDDHVRRRMRAAFNHPQIRRLSSSRAADVMLREAGSSAVATVTCGLDTDTWRVTRPPAGRSPVVGFPLRNEEHKGMAEAFEAAEQIRRRIPSARIAAFGSADVTAPSVIDARGRLSNQELLEFYNECAVFLLPSRFEGWGLPAAEAMACGAAVVTTANGGVEDFAADGASALIVPPGDAEAMADAVCRLLGDSDLRGRIVAGGLERASRMSWDAATDRLLAALAA